MVVEEASPAAARAVYNAMSKKEKFEKKPLFVSNYAIFSHSWVSLENESLPGSGQAGDCSNI